MIRRLAFAAALAASASTLSTGALAQTSPSSLVSLVNVDLRNVLNDLSVKLNLDKSNLPITIQLPIQIAANVCGVSINVLAASTGGQANCAATSAPQSLTQAVQLQMAAGGSVGGGAQSTSATNAGQTAQPATAATAAPSASGSGQATTSTPSTGTPK